MRRPINDPVRITGDRASHAAYNVGPATDYAVPIGTPVLAPFHGRLSKYKTSDGGLGVVLVGGDATFYGQHLWVRLLDGTYAEGARIALSGNTGTLTTGPHLHCYVIVHATGERLSMEEYLARAAGGDAQPFTPDQTAPTSEEDDMRFFDSTCTIYWPNGVFCSYEQNNYTLIKQYYLYPDHTEWSKGRENFLEAAHGAVGYVAGVTAAAVAKAVDPAGATNVDVVALAAQLVKVMPKTFTFTAK